MGKRIIISMSSDIGLALCQSWLVQGHEVFGTYRTHNESVAEAASDGAKVYRCDLLDHELLEQTCEILQGEAEDWETLVLAPGFLGPVGPIEECDFSEWEQSLSVNLINQLKIVHKLLPTRQRSTQHLPSVVFFAGGGSNSAVANFSAYTLSKIALTKMCELLDAEISDAKFTIIGPGWVKTKIHDMTLEAAELAGESYQRTIDMIENDDHVPMSEVIRCVDWVVSSPRNVVGGRNISLVHDAWGDPALDEKLKQDADMYKLRRHGNDYKP